MSDYDSGFNVAAPYTTATPVDDAVAATIASSFQAPAASQRTHTPNMGARSMSNDPWAAAAAGPATSPAGTREHNSAAAYGQPNPDASSLGDAYAPEPEAQSSLFGPTLETLPSLFTLSHAPGTKIKGKIFAKPRDVQSTCHPSQSPDKQSRLKQYWVTDPSTGKRSPGLAAVDPLTGKPNDPVKNLVISMETGERDPQIEGDDGRRSWFVSGTVKAPKGHVVGEPVMSSRLALMDAIKLANSSGISITSDASMVGKVIEVHRVRREQPNVSTSSWFWQARIAAS